MHRRPAVVGSFLSDIDTPALVVDLDVLERNIVRMATAAAGRGVALRPHAKAHKSLDIARRQLEAGATGLACQKVSEAEIFVDGGVTDVLVTNEIVADAKVARVTSLARRACIAVCVDDARNVAALAASAAAAKTEIVVLVEINTADYRAGVSPGRPALELAERIVEARHLTFGGLQAYNGPAQHIRSHRGRQIATDRVARGVRDTRALLEEAEIACPVVTGAGTGSYDLEPETGAFTEVQPGSYVFMDGDYLANRDAEGGPFRDFEVGLYVVAGVMSRRAGVAIVDVGSKAISMGNGLPLVADPADAVYVHFGDEHGTIRLTDDTGDLLPGESVRLIPYNCDPTVNLYNWYVGVRGEVVEEVFPVSARGAIY